MDIIGAEQDLIDIAEDDLLGAELPLNNAKVKLKWDLHSSNWQGLKLIINLEDLNSKEGKENG